QQPEFRPRVGKAFSFGPMEIAHMNRLAIDDGPAGHHLTVDRNPVPDDGNRSMLRLEDEIMAILQRDGGIIGFAIGRHFRRSLAGPDRPGTDRGTDRDTRKAYATREAPRRGQG